MANIKEIQSIIEKSKDTVIILTMDEIQKCCGKLPKSYEKASAFTAKNKPFYKNCEDKGYTVIEVHSPTHNVVSNKSVINLASGAGYSVVLLKTTIPSTPDLPVMTPRSSSTGSPVGDVLQYLMANSSIAVDPRGLAELTRANATIVNGCIPRGIPGLAKRYLSNAHTLYTRLAGGIPHGFNFRSYENVKAVVSQMDKDNGTLDNKNHKGSAIDAFTRFIVDPKNDFERKLDGPTPVIKQLPDDLLNYYLKMPNAYRAKSLASKVCKYFHEYRYGKDKFFINDSVVRKMLPYYCDKYGIPHPSKRVIDSLSYSDLFDLLDLVYSHCSSAISKSDFDHILWYCYRK